MEQEKQADAVDWKRVAWRMAGFLAVVLAVSALAIVGDRNPRETALT